MPAPCPALRPSFIRKIIRSTPLGLYGFRFDVLPTLLRYPLFWNLVKSNVATRRRQLQAQTGEGQAWAPVLRNSVPTHTRLYRHVQPQTLSGRKKRCLTATGFSTFNKKSVSMESKSEVKQILSSMPSDTVDTYLQRVKVQHFHLAPSIRPGLAYSERMKMKFSPGFCRPLMIKHITEVMS